MKAAEIKNTHKCSCIRRAIVDEEDGAKAEDDDNEEEEEENEKGCLQVSQNKKPR